MKHCKRLNAQTKSQLSKYKNCLRILKAENNKTVLSQHRDSWLVATAKTVCTLGLIYLYRALMGCEVTHGIQLVTMFAKQSQELGIQLDDVDTHRMHRAHRM